MKKVRFIGENLIDEDGKVVISEEELIAKCILNVEYSHRVIEIVKHTIRGLGYELVNNTIYRRSPLFNKVEDTILKSGLYMADRNKRPRTQKRNVGELYIVQNLSRQQNNIARYVKQRPGRFSNPREW